MIYLLDANLISDMLVKHSQVMLQVDQHLVDGHSLAVCRPIYYELLRGLWWKNAEVKLRVLHDKILPRFDWIPLHDDDWLQAARFWADTVKQGRTLSDMDFLLASITKRLNAILVSSDDDFDALPITRENWRE